MTIKLQQTDEEKRFENFLLARHKLGLYSHTLKDEIKEYESVSLLVL